MTTNEARTIEVITGLAACFYASICNQIDTRMPISPITVNIFWNFISMVFYHASTLMHNFSRMTVSYSENQKHGPKIVIYSIDSNQLKVLFPKVTEILESMNLEMKLLSRLKTFFNTLLSILNEEIDLLFRLVVIGG